MSEEVKKSYFTTGQMRNALIQIEDKMVHSNWMPNIILGINRGGCIPGVYLSHRLKTAHEVLDIRLYLISLDFIINFFPSTSSLIQSPLFVTIAKYLLSLERLFFMFE